MMNLTQRERERERERERDRQTETDKETGTETKKLQLGRAPQFYGNTVDNHKIVLDYIMSVGVVGKLWCEVKCEYWQLCYNVICWPLLITQSFYRQIGGCGMGVGDHRVDQ